MSSIVPSQCIILSQVNLDLWVSQLPQLIGYEPCAVTAPPSVVFIVLFPLCLCVFLPSCYPAFLVAFFTDSWGYLRFRGSLSSVLPILASFDFGDYPRFKGSPFLLLPSLVILQFLVHLCWALISRITLELAPISSTLPSLSLVWEFLGLQNSFLACIFHWFLGPQNQRLLIIYPIHPTIISFIFPHPFLSSFHSFLPSLPWFISSSSFSMSITSQSQLCNWCLSSGHTEDSCFAKQASQQLDKENARKRLSRNTSKSYRSSHSTSHSIPKPSSTVSTSHSHSNITPFKEYAVNATTLLSTGLSTPRSDWCVDSGCSSHMTPHRSFFVEYTPHVIPILIANGHIIHSAGIGTVHFKPIVKGHPANVVILKNVLHVPELSQSLLSVMCLTVKHGYKVVIVRDC